MDEIITVNKLTWDNRSNDVFGLCANHLFISYQLYNFLSIRKLKKALDEGLIYPVTESLVVAITDLCDSKNKLEIVIAIPMCSHKLSEIFEILYGRNINALKQLQLPGIIGSVANR